MPSTERAGQRLSYETYGDETGPVVLLLHPLTTDATAFEACGLVEQLVREGCRVIAPAALGHRGSGAPLEPDRYALGERVADVQAVLDAEGVDRFACYGYSMGGWTAWGLLATAPERCLAVAVGGWDPIGGVAGLPRPLAAPLLRPSLRLMRLRPDLRRMLEGTDRRALALALLALYDEQASVPAETLQQTPLMLWVGQGDAYRRRLEPLAARLGLSLLVVPGNHGSAFRDRAAHAAVGDFLLEHAARPSPRG